MYRKALQVIEGLARPQKAKIKAGFYTRFLLLSFKSFSMYACLAFSTFAIWCKFSRWIAMEPKSRIKPNKNKYSEISIL